MWSPVEENARGEPKLYFVSHGDCVANEIEEAKDLSAGAVLLRILAEAILKETHFEATYG